MKQNLFLLRALPIKLPGGGIAQVRFELTSTPSLWNFFIIAAKILYLKTEYFFLISTTELQNAFAFWRDSNPRPFFCRKIKSLIAVNTQMLNAYI